MTDWSTGVEGRNYKIPHRPDSRSLVDLLASMFCVLLVAGSLVGYVWIRSRIVALGYQIQTVRQQEKSLQRVQNSLILEEETLTSPERIDQIARTDLAMEPVSPFQRLIPRFHEINAQPESLVLANVQPAGVATRRSSANN